MKTTIVPYELLVRWKPDGSISGAHIVRAAVTTDAEGRVVTHTPLPPEPAGEAGAAFPLAQAVTQALADGLAALPRL